MIESTKILQGDDVSIALTSSKRDYAGPDLPNQIKKILLIPTLNPALHKLFVASCGS